MKVEPNKPASAAEMRQKAQVWYDSQIKLLAACHGDRWEEHRAWLEDYLKATLRARLIANGWVPKR